MPRFVRARARFVEAVTGNPLPQGKHRVELRDLDPIRDDHLGHGHFVGNGVVEVLFSLSDASSWDSPGELMPDLYMVLYEGHREIYRTPVKLNVFIPLKELFTSEGSPTVDLGVFVVPTSK
jgi:hypothetical protein